MTPLDRLIHELGKLPGIGERTATRLAFYVLRQPQAYAHALVSSIRDVKEKITLCSQCMNITEINPCQYCQDHRRDDAIICVVEEPSDLIAVERTHAYKGKYHVLHGALSPLDGVGPEDIKIRELMSRLSQESVNEVILATNPNVEGEATALYLTRLIKPSGISVSRLASGMPVGSDLEYIDATTLSRAFEDRRLL